MDTAPSTLRASPAPLIRATLAPRTGPPLWRDDALVRIRPGIYTVRTMWDALEPWDRYRVRVHAFALARPDAVFSHESAASLLGLPTFGHPRAIHIFDARRSRSVTYGDVTAHTSMDPRSTSEFAGIRFTPVEDVVTDLARVLPPAFALAVGDAAVARFGLHRKVLLDRLDAQRNAFGVRRARWTLQRVTASGESPGESISRAVIEWCGFPEPELQREHEVEGRVYRSDFCWPDRKIIGEMDGWVKYDDADPAEATEVLRAEKRREDALRRRGWHVARWDYAGVLSVGPLRAALVAAGLRPIRRPETAALASVGRNPRSM